MRKPVLSALLLTLALGASIAALYWVFFRNAQPETTLLPEGVGMVTAEEVIQLAGGQGKIVLILPRRGNYQDPLIAAQQKAFEKALARSPRMSLLATEFLETERPGTMGAGGIGPEDFTVLVKRHAEADVFVSMAGFPEFTKEALASLPGKKFVVVGGTGVQLKPLLVAGVVQTVILPRGEPPVTGAKPRTAREWFNQNYEVLKPANAGAVR